MPDGPFGWNVFTWAWNNRAEIKSSLRSVYDWFRGRSRTDPDRGILLIGPGGAGKTTLARLLSGDFDWLLDEPWRYDESFGIEQFTLEDDPAVGIVVPPGQHRRREATWAEVEQNLAAGRYRGVILVIAYGYHSIGRHSYRDHPLYNGNKDEFLSAYTARCRADEAGVLRRIAPHLQAAGKIWLLTVAAKEDLWWADRQQADGHYTAGPYAEGLAAVHAGKGQDEFRHELVPASLVIGNFVTGEDELLQKCVAGYDHRRQVESVRRLFEAVKALRDWEVGS